MLFGAPWTSMRLNRRTFLVASCKNKNMGYKETGHLTFRPENTLVREKSVYCAPLETPLTVTTGALTLEKLSPTTAAATFEDQASLDFFKGFDERIVQAVTQHKDAWFGQRGAELDDQFLRDSFKSFWASETGLKVRVAEDDEDLIVYDTAKQLVGSPTFPSPETRVKAVLEFSKITFGKTTYGGMWKLKQLKLLDTPSYLFDDETAPEEGTPSQQQQQPPQEQQQKVLFPELAEDLEEQHCPNEES